MRVCIEVVSCEDRPPAEALRAEFAAPGGSIGRGEHNDLVLPDPDRMISRTHAEVRILDHGEIELHDLGRATAVFVNGEAIGHGLSRRVDGSERLSIGNYTLQLSLLADPPAELPASPALATPAPVHDPDASIVLPQAELLALAERYGMSSPALPATAPPLAVPAAGSGRKEQELLSEALAAMDRYFAARDSGALAGRVGIAVAAALRDFAPDQLQRQLLDRLPAADVASPAARDARLWQLYCSLYHSIAEQAMQKAMHALEDRPGN